KDDIFYDPFLDGEKNLVPLKIIVWGQADSALPHSLAMACTDAETSDFVCAVRLLVCAFAATASAVSKADYCSCSTVPRDPVRRVLRHSFRTCRAKPPPTIPSRNCGTARTLVGPQR